MSAADDMDVDARDAGRAGGAGGEAARVDGLILSAPPAALAPAPAAPAKRGAYATLSAARGAHDGAVLASWRKAIATKQRSEMTAERLEELRAQALRQSRLSRRVKSARRKCASSSMKKSAFAGAMISYQSASASVPARAAAATGSGRTGLGTSSLRGMLRGRAAARGAAPAGARGDESLDEEAGAVLSADIQQAFGACSAPQSMQQATRNAEAVSTALRTLQVAEDESDEDEAEKSMQSARMQLLGAGQAWAGRGDRGVEEAGRAVASSGLQALLSQLRVEPPDEEEQAAKFKLYEAHAETVSASRDGLLSFWAECESEFSDQALAGVRQRIAKIDDTNNLGIYDDPRTWFVHGMATTAARNGDAIDEVLRRITTMLELLRLPADCPICLEPLSGGADGGDGAADATEAAADGAADAVTLSCAHRVCADCWQGWKASCEARGRAPFCPLCRNDEFLADILEGDE